MPPDPPSPGVPYGGDPLADPALMEALASIRALASDRFEILGPLGRDAAGEFALLAREIATGRLTVLKRVRSKLQIIERLDASVPPPAGACPVCQAPFSGWDPACPDCGADLAGSVGALGSGVSREQVLAAVKAAATGYEVLGDMPRAAGGANVYFAREGRGRSIVALRLEHEGESGGRSGFTVQATRMMRPKLLYGTVGGEARPQQSAPLWTPVPSPQVRTPSSLTGNPNADRVCPQCGDTFGPDLRFCPRDGSALRVKSPSEDLVGQVIAERYHILSKLGEGGMGQVYLAEHVRMGRRCAVKVMNPMLLHDPDSVSRFNREAANASRISHANVAQVYDFGESDNLVYLAMEFVEGESLGALLERERKLSQRRAIDICRQVADGLSAAHDLGIIHRDLKPDNVMLARSKSGRDIVKVVDFGIAKATGAGKQTVTRTGYVVGTPAYMSPEQILGDALDPRSDIYSLGCILYETLTGERAFAAPSGEVSIRQRLTEPPPPPRRINRRLTKKLDALVTTAMARVPDQRFQSATELSEALAVAGAEAPVSRPWRRLLPWGKSREPSAESARIPTPQPVSPTAMTEPVPLGWSEAVQPQVRPPVRGSTILRHRSARPPGRNPGVFVGAAVLAAGLAFGAWRVLSLGPASETPDAEEEVLVLPEPELTPPPEPSAPDTTPGAPPTPAPVAPGMVWFAEPLPFDARVRVDGREVNLPPNGLLSLPPGSHTIRVEAPGFRPASRSARIASGETDTLRIRLSAAPAGPAPSPAPPPAPAPEPEPEPERPLPPGASGTIVVNGTLPPNGEISVDGTPMPAGDRAFALAPGTHWLRVSAPGYRPDSAALQVKPGVEIHWEAPHLTALPRPEAAIEVLIENADTTVTIGDTLQLEAAVRDETGTYLDRRLTWESGNPAVVAVERGGRMTAKAPGRAYVRAYSGEEADSMLVTVPAPPKPAPAPRRPGAPPSAPVASAPSPEDVQKALAACTKALGSGKEREIVEIYQPRTAQDISNLRKVLEVAIKPEADFGAKELKVGALPPPSAVATSVEVPLQIRFNWRNNAGVNKKKDAPFLLELARGGDGWELAGCRASEKLSF